MWSRAIPLCVGPCFLLSFAQTGTPSLPPHYQGSPLLWVPPTSTHHRPFPRLLSLVHGCALSCAPMTGSPWLPHIRNVRLDTASDPGEHPLRLPFRLVGCCLLKGQTHRRSPSEFFGASTPSRPASPVTIAPRLLSYLRINQPVTALTARLDTGPVASGYPDGISSR